MQRARSCAKNDHDRTEPNLFNGDDYFNVVFLYISECILKRSRSHRITITNVFMAARPIYFRFCRSSSGQRARSLNTCERQRRATTWRKERLARIRDAAKYTFVRVSNRNRKRSKWTGLNIRLIESERQQRRKQIPHTEKRKSKRKERERERFAWILERRITLKTVPKHEFVANENKWKN